MIRLKFELNISPVGNHNYVLGNDEFYLSFQPAQEIAPGLPSFDAETDKGETALCLNTPRVWYILNGDFRKQYEDAFPQGLEACKKVFFDNIKHKSNWSTYDDKT